MSSIGSESWRVIVVLLPVLSHEVRREIAGIVQLLRARSRVVILAFLRRHQLGIDKVHRRPGSSRSLRGFRGRLLESNAALLDEPADGFLEGFRPLPEGPGQVAGQMTGGE